MTFVVGAASFALLAFELALVRTLELEQAPGFAPLVVGVAMLGIGASGAVLALWKASRRRPPPPSGPLRLFALALPASALLWKLVPLRAEAFGWDPFQLACLAAAYLVFGVPFFLGALGLGACFAFGAPAAGRLYAADLAGAAAGSLAALALSFAGGPELALALAGLAGVAAAWRSGAPRRGLDLALLLSLGCGALPVRLSEYRALPQARLLADFEPLAERRGPLGSVVAARSSAARYAPGLSLAYEGSVPRQVGLYSDGELAASVSPPGSRHLEWLPHAVPFALRPPRRALVVGADGGLTVELALRFGADSVRVAELDPAMARLLEGVPPFTDPRVRLEASAGRGGEGLDAVFVSPPRAARAALSGAGAMVEAGAFTVEAFEAGLAALAPDGWLAAAAWARWPPRDGPRLFAGMAEALRRRGLAPGPRLVWLRTWGLSIVVASPRPFDEGERERLRALAASRGFDLAWLEGLGEAESNRFHATPEPLHHRAAAALLGEGRRAFLAAYPYDVSPAVDARPYFHDFHKLGAQWRLLTAPDPMSLHYVEWGRALAWAGLALALLFGAPLALAPLAVRALRREARRRPGAGLYFAGLGLGYMLVELPALGQGALFLGSATLSAGAVLACFLAASAAGARWSEGRWSEPRRARLGAAGTLAWGALHLLLWPAVSGAAAGWPLPDRFALLVAWCAPGAFAMGFLFPAGLAAARRLDPHLAAWGWGVNGCASVVGAALAGVLAPSLGLPQTLGLGLLGYLAAWASADALS